MKITHISLFALACGAAPLAVHSGVEIGVNIGGPEVIVGTQPPPPRAEVITTNPGPGFIWIRGHWGWHREHWEWIGGRWDRVAQPNSVWVPGQWVHRGHGWVWTEGHYTVTAAPPPPGQQVEAVASEEPPQNIVEAVPVAPGPDYFWIGGHWHWRGGWVWLPGRYERHPHLHPGGYWEPGRWDHRGGNWVWHEGRWR